MRETTNTGLLAIAVAIAFFGTTVPRPAMAADFVIGVGEGAPVHLHIARALCRAIGKSVSGMSCEAKRIEAGDAAEQIAVLNDVRNNSIDIGIAQTDWVHHAHAGTGPVKFMGKMDNLRTLFVLHSEPFTLVARHDSGIAGIENLFGKRVNIGRPGSDQRLVMNQVMETMGWTRESFQVADELTGPEQSLALCHNRIQAMVTTVAHPNSSLAKTLSLCGAEIVPVAGGEIDKLLAGRPYFTTAAIPAGVYAGQPAVKTFGVRVAAVASEDVSDEVVKVVVEAVFDNLNNIKRLHPALGGLNAAEMTGAGAGAPLHKGAEAHFRDAGMM